jgi:phospholipase/carboxylesterase
MIGRNPDAGGHALHQGEPIAHAGAALSQAKAVMILLHGRGASADGILSLAEAFADPEIAYFAPQAAGHSWYPHSFLAPLAHNEPWLSSALQVIAGMVRDLERDGIPSSRIVLLGFSQGGCLALEFAARNAGRYGAVIGLSAGLIGPDETSRTYAGSLQGTPVLLGCSDLVAARCCTGTKRGVLACPSANVRVPSTGGSPRIPKNCESSTSAARSRPRGATASCHH